MDFLNHRERGMLSYQGTVEIRKSLHEFEETHKRLHEFEKI
jgi:hypothetical protein